MRGAVLFLLVGYLRMEQSVDLGSVRMADVH